MAKTTVSLTDKIDMLDTVLAELSSLGPVDANTLRQNWQTRRAVERDLQLLDGLAVDICQKIITQAGYKAARTSGDAVRQCIKMKVLTDNPRYYAMVGIGPLFFQRHEPIDPGALASVVNNVPADFARFRAEVMDYIEKN